MVVDMSFTKKVKTGNCKILIITYIFFVNLLLTLTNQPLIACQYSRFVLTKNAKEIFWDLNFLSEVTGCRKTEVSEHTGSTVHVNVSTLTIRTTIHNM